jgi:hypothetical protein
MKLQKRGKPTLPAEVTHISPNGIWMLVDEAEYFLPYDTHPWFRSATVDQILNVVRPAPGHLHWPQLDADLELESLQRPEAYPLVYR